MVTKKHATGAEKEARIEMVVTLITQGFSVSQIRKRVADAAGISDRQAGRYIDEALERISLFGSTPIGLEKGMLAKRMEHLLSRALLEKNHNLALDIVKSQVNLLQISYKYQSLGAPLPHDPTPASPPSEQPGVEELLRLFEADQSAQHAKRTE